MAKVYMLTDADFEKLILMIDQNPEQSHGSSAHTDDAARRIYLEAHRRYNYWVRKWITEVQRG